MTLIPVTYQCWECGNKETEFEDIGEERIPSLIKWNICPDCREGIKQEQERKDNMSLKFKCNFCPDVLPNFKTLVEHYEEKHRGKLKRYLVKNRKVGQQALIYAASPKETCKALGWDMRDCHHIEEIK